MTMDVYDSIFKAYDIRGKVGDELNSTVVTNIGLAFAKWLPSTGPIAVGRDMRPDSEELANALIEGLLHEGREVWDIGQVTSDMIYFTVGHYNLAGGAMITASHNPGAYNGIKLCGELASPIGEESGLVDIKKLSRNSSTRAQTKKGISTHKDITEEWISHCLSFIDPAKLKAINLVVDAGNGMAGKIFPELEPYVPFNVTEMYFELDGTFPNHIANPLEPKNLEDLISRVNKTKADVGLAFDGDGDRAVLIDEKGEALTGTVVTSILAEYFLKQNHGATILYNAICGRAAIDTIKSNAGKGIRTRVGHSFIKADMKKHNAVFAGEHSGHYYFKSNFNADSGLISAIIVLYVLSLSNKSLSELALPFRKSYFQIPETNFKVADKDIVIRTIADTFSEGSQDMLDGLTVNFSNSWFNVRPSNTEPLLRLNAEAKSQSELDALVAKVTKLITG